MDSLLREYNKYCSTNLARIKEEYHAEVHRRCSKYHDAAASHHSRGPGETSDDSSDVEFIAIRGGGMSASRQNIFFFGHMDLTTVPGDGNCGYSSLILGGLDEDTDVQKLRDLFVSTKDTHLWSKFVKPNLGAVREIAPANFKKFYESEEAYVDGISKGVVWIDSMILKVLAVKLVRDIVVFENNCLPKLFSSHDGGNATHILCEAIPQHVFENTSTIYLLHSYGCHYDNYRWKNEYMDPKTLWGKYSQI